MGAGEGGEEYADKESGEKFHPGRIGPNPVCNKL
jgi:hypothetical protein